MSMTINIHGIKLPDEKWKKMKAVYDACNNARIYIPQEIYEYQVILI